MPPTIAAIVPCYNEEKTIFTVVASLEVAVPGIIVYVYDNNSSDNTAAEAERAGARVVHCQCPGKGNVMAQAFREVDADIYLMIDGDDTYDASHAPDLINLLIDGGYDHVVGARPKKNSHRFGHDLGNWFFNFLVKVLFGTRPFDMLSGYRALTNDFVAGFYPKSKGFEIETEIELHCIKNNIKTGVLNTTLVDRPEGSHSKLSTVKDGWAILKFIIKNR